MFLYSLFLAPLACPWMIWAINPEVVARQGKATTTTSSTLNSASVYSVLLTALPSSLLNLAQTNAPAVSSIIQSDLANGKTPAWFTALPKDIQTYLVPATVTNTPDTTRSNLEPTIEIPTATTLQTTSTPAPGPAGEPTPPTGLSIGAKVGIGVGVPIAVIAVAAVAGAYLLGVRRGSKRDVDFGAGAKVLDPSDELNASSSSSRAVDDPAPGGAELPTAANVVELPADKVESSSLPPRPRLGKDARTAPARTASVRPVSGGSGDRKSVV